MPENIEEKLKRQKIEIALTTPDTALSEWQTFAKTDYGLVNGECSPSCVLFECLMFYILFTR